MIRFMIYNRVAPCPKVGCYGSLFPDQDGRLRCLMCARWADDEVSVLLIRNVKY